MSTEIITTELSSNLDALVKKGVACANMENNFSKAFAVAQCIQDLRHALTDDVLNPIKELQGTALGFRTDKDSQGGYTHIALKDALIEAFMNGLMPVGNQFNIIGGRMYITKEGFTYLLRKIPNLRYTINLGIPSMKDHGEKKGAIVKAIISWQQGDSEAINKHEYEIPVRLNTGMGCDAALGKAERKAKCWLYNNLTGQTLSDGEIEDDTPRNITPSPKAPTFLPPTTEETPTEPSAPQTTEPEPLPLFGTEITPNS